MDVKVSASIVRSPIAHSNNNGVATNDATPVNSPNISQSPIQPTALMQTDDMTKPIYVANNEIAEALDYIKAMLDTFLKQQMKNTQDIKEIKELLQQQPKQLSSCEDPADITEDFLPIENIEQLQVLESRLQSDKQFKKAMVIFLV